MGIIEYLKKDILVLHITFISENIFSQIVMGNFVATYNSFFLLNAYLHELLIRIYCP